MKMIKCVLMFLVLGCPGVTMAASFDCTKAGTRIEKTICSDEKLSEYDELLSKRYKEAKAIDPSVVSTQREWLKQRNQATSVEELDRLHLERIDVLAKLVTLAPMERYPADSQPMVRGEQVTIEQPIQQNLSPSQRKLPPARPGNYKSSKEKNAAMMQQFDEYQGAFFEDRWIDASAYTPGKPQWWYRCAKEMAAKTDMAMPQLLGSSGQYDDYMKRRDMFLVFFANGAMDKLEQSTGGNLSMIQKICIREGYY